MIVDRMERLGLLSSQHKDLLVVDEYFRNHKVDAMDNGTYDLSEHIFMNVMTYKTGSMSDRYEAHRDFIDIHILLEGSEKLYWSDTKQMVTVDPYDAATDCELLRGSKTGEVKIKKGMFLICYPEDAHMPGVYINGKSAEVKKAVVKLRRDRMDI